MVLTAVLAGVGLAFGLWPERSVLVGTAVGVFGVASTLCLLIYDARSGQLLDELTVRGQDVEASLGLEHGSFRRRPGTWLVFDSGFRIRVSHDTAHHGVFFAALVAWMFVVMDPALQALLTERTGRGGAAVVAVILSALMVAGLAAVVYQMRDDRVRWLRRRLAEAVALFRQGDIQRAAALAAEISDRPSADVVRRAQSRYRGPQSDESAMAAVAELSEVPKQWVSTAMRDGRD